MSNCPILGDVSFDHLVRIVSISFLYFKICKKNWRGQSLRLCKCPVSHQIVTILSLLTPVTWINYHYSGCRMVSSSLLMLWLIFCEEEQSLSIHCLFIYISVDSWIPTLFSKFQYMTAMYFDSELFPHMVYGSIFQLVSMSLWFFELFLIFLAHQGIWSLSCTFPKEPWFL